jgi:glycosyltransferase involved in cell wall biosynthesis
MKLTVFLVTKGREKFLDQILKSLDKIVQPYVDFLVLDNGAQESIGATLKVWQDKNPDRIEIVRFDENDSRPSVYWGLLRERGVDWVVCPSDDDEIRFEIIEEWENALTLNPNLVGFAASAALMDENGDLTGEVITPSAIAYTSTIEQVAAGFYEPPFHWPSLFIRVSSLPALTPPSRYAFDWWIGLQLLIAGNVETTESIGINYRVHSQQESFLAPLRRKYFEAHIWISELTKSDEFFKWIQALSDAERVYIWDQLLKSLPIYGDEDFSRPILSNIYMNLVKTSRSAQTAITLANLYSLHYGVFLKNGEVKNLISHLPPIESRMEGNINIGTNPNVCDKVRFACEEISSELEFHHYNVYCFHGKRSMRAIAIDCNILHENQVGNNSDLIIGQITDYLEKSGTLSLILTSGEKVLIRVFRKLKKRMPRFLRVYLRVLKSRN